MTIKVKNFQANVTNHYHMGLCVKLHLRDKWKRPFTPGIEFGAF